MKKYIVSGLLLVICIVSSILFINPSVISVSSSNTSSRKLPIYCVQTEKKQVSISFDAAWGDVK